MEITRNADRKDLVEWANQILSLSSVKGDSTAKEEVNQAIKGLEGDRFCLTILGKAKRGKSTFLNAILGRKDDVVAPVDKLPASSTISRFHWNSTEHCTVVFRDGHKEEIGYSRIRDFVTEESNKGNFKAVDVVEVMGPFPNLDHDLVLVDTPGAGSIHEYHDTILHAFIPQADAIIFLVTARMPLDQDELDLLKKVKAADIQKVFFAVNRVDECSDQDIADAVTHNMRLLTEIGINVGRIHKISGKEAFKGDLSGSGVGALMEEISTFLLVNKGRVLTTRFVSRVCNAIGPVLQTIDVQVASSRKTVGELNAELATLIQKKTAIASEREFTEREFNTAWSGAADAFEYGLKGARAETIVAMSGKIQGLSIFNVSAFAKDLPTLLAQTIDEHLCPIASKFESSAREACDRLQTSYPELNIESSGSVSIKTREGHALITGAVTGTVAAAAGLAIATTGAAVATTIAAANAAALAATASVAAPSILTTLLPAALNLAGLGYLAPAAASLTIGTASVAAPAAISTVPLWVALAGPVGWTIAGVGLLAVPFSWRLSKLKMKDQIEEASEKQISETFGRLQTDRLPLIRNTGKTIMEEIRLRLDRQLAQIESVIVAARDRRPDDSERSQLLEAAARLRDLLARHGKKSV